MAKKIRAANQLVEMFGRQIPKGRADGYNRTTFRLSKAAKHAMDIRVAQDGYGLRGKSRWIMDAVNEILDPKTWGRPGLENPLDRWLHQDPIIGCSALREWTSARVATLVLPAKPYTPTFNHDELEPVKKSKAYRLRFDQCAWKPNQGILDFDMI